MKSAEGYRMNVFMIVGAIIFMVSVSLIDSEGKVWKWAVAFSIIGLLLIIGGCFMQKPVDVEARGNTFKSRGAGVTAHMNATLYNSLNDTFDGKHVRESDIDLLARLITAEQGYSDGVDADDYELRAYLVGSVVINRIKSKDFPDTLWDVIYQKGQYQCVDNGHIYKEYDPIAWEIAEELLIYGTDVPKNVLFQAEFPQADGIYKQIGNTYFCWKAD
jgi:hypothetical protein